ncbi:MAG: esterase-like activity of phytase family protein, partial [Verrucomicrobia bacterium]|nr:esterase-like activity of phytase family protein [Verrucomicrobiota bacterium]
LGSVSGLVVTNWATAGAGSYTGQFNILPDRGYNSGSVYSDYAARINQFDVTFTPLTPGSSIGGTDLASKIAAQNQIVATYNAGGSVKFTYNNGSTQVTTTGLNPTGAAGAATISAVSSSPVPFVSSYTPTTGPNAGVPQTVNKLSLDSEALVLKADGSGYIGDEYGANIYHFNSSKQIDGVVGIPDALKPQDVTGATNFSGDSAPAQLDGRRINQGLEGVSLSPDGTKLFALLQSATIQDNAVGSKDQNRENSRLLVYDVSGTSTPTAPTQEYVMQLPTYRNSGNGSAADKTAAQSEIVALDNNRILVLARDGTGAGGTVTNNPTVVKSVLLADLSIGNPTNIAGTARDSVGGMVVPGGSVNVIATSGNTVTVSSIPSGLAVGSGLLGRTVSSISANVVTLNGALPAGMPSTGTAYFNNTTDGALDPSITPVSWTEAVNMLNTTQLANYNINTTFSSGNVNMLSLSEKWEGMSLVSALDPLHPNDYFLFLGNDNDFVTGSGTMTLSDGSTTFNGIPTGGTQNDTMFLAYRVTVVPEPSRAILMLLGAAGLMLRRRRLA